MSGINNIWRNLPDVIAMSTEDKNNSPPRPCIWSIASSIAEFFAAGSALHRLSRDDCVDVCGYFLACWRVRVAREHAALLCWFPVIGFSREFLRSSPCICRAVSDFIAHDGRGFLLHIGRIAALSARCSSFVFKGGRSSARCWLYAGFLFLPAAVLSSRWPHAKD